MVANVRVRTATRRPTRRQDLLVNPAAHAEGHEPLKTLAACALAEPGGVADWFLTALAVAHTVLLDVDLDTGEKSYNADSPDEVALVKAGVSMSYVFESRQGDSAIFISKGGKAMQFEVLESVEFTSARKRMSVIVREKVRGGSVVGSSLADDGSPHGADERRSSARGGGGGGTYYLLTKGADSVMLDPQPNGRAPRVRATDGVQSLRAQLDGYAVEGLRTLVFAYKPLDARWCDAGSSGSWLSRYRGARQASRVSRFALRVSRFASRVVRRASRLFLLPVSQFPARPPGNVSPVM